MNATNFESFRESAEKLRKEQKMLKKALRTANGQAEATEVIEDLGKWQQHRTDFCCRVTESDLSFDEQQAIFRVLESEDVQRV